MSVNKINEELSNFLTEETSEVYITNLEKAEKFGNDVIIPELKKLFYSQGLYSPKMDRIKLNMVDSFMSFVNFDLQPTSTREMINSQKNQYLDSKLLENEAEMEIKLNELAKQLEEELGFKCVNYVFADQHEAGIELGGKELYGE